MLLCSLASAAETDWTLFPSQPEPKAATAEPEAAVAAAEPKAADAAEPETAADPKDYDAAAEPNAAQPAQTDDDAAPKDEQAQSESGTPDKKTEEIPSKAGKTRGAKRPAEEAAPAAKKVKA